MVAFAGKRGEVDDRMSASGQESAGGRLNISPFTPDRICPWHPPSRLGAPSLSPSARVNRGRDLAVRRVHLGSNRTFLGHASRAASDLHCRMRLRSARVIRDLFLVLAASNHQSSRDLQLAEDIALLIRFGSGVLGVLIQSFDLEACTWARGN